MELIEVASQKERIFFENLYIKAFPKSERMDLKEIYKFQKEGKIEIKLLIDKDNFVGLVVLNKSNTINLLSYFAIDTKYRGQGYGSATLNLIKIDYPDLLIEIESTQKRYCDDLYLRKRRKEFYKRNGFNTLDNIVSYFGIEMELMSTMEDAGIHHYFENYNELYKKEYINKNIKIVN